MPQPPNIIGISRHCCGPPQDDISEQTFNQCLKKTPLPARGKDSLLTLQAHNQPPTAGRGNDEFFVHSVIKTFRQNKYYGMNR